MVKKTNLIKSVGILLFAIYLLLLFYFLLFAEELGRSHVTNRVVHYNPVLFAEIKRFFIYRTEIGFWGFFLNIFGNILIFMPFGFFVPMLVSRYRKNIIVILYGFLLSLSIEIIQGVAKVGSFDVDDIFLNTVGTILGFIFFSICDFIRRRIVYGKKI